MNLSAILTNLNSSSQPSLSLRSILITALSASAAALLIKHILTPKAKIKKTITKQSDEQNDVNQHELSPPPTFPGALPLIGHTIVGLRYGLGDLFRMALEQVGDAAVFKSLPGFPNMLVLQGSVYCHFIMHLHI
jgi:hypothetical protein